MANLSRHETGNGGSAKAIPKVTRHSLTLQQNRKKGSPSKSKALTDSKDSFKLSLFSLKNNDLEKNSEGYL